jgi:hypothetical protein
MSEFQKRIVCPCGWSCESAFGTFLSTDPACCPHCGRDRPMFSYSPARGWRIVTMRWIPDRGWWARLLGWGKWEAINPEENSDAKTAVNA